MIFLITHVIILIFYIIFLYIIKITKDHLVEYHINPLELNQPTIIYIQFLSFVKRS